MSAIFISHSNEDKEAARIVQSKLRNRGYVASFLDTDPTQGIAAGKEWEKSLYHHLAVCRAVIVLVSAASMNSRWCFAEVVHAKALGKEIFPIKIGPSVPHDLLISRQVIDLTEGEDAWVRLWIGLKQAGLDPNDSFDWEINRAPYPGFNFFDIKDAWVYFGRDDDIKNASATLNQLRRRGEPTLALVVGASGSGKSSLLRAGIVARLRKDIERWFVVSPFRPRREPLTEFAKAFAESCPAAAPAGWKYLLDEWMSSNPEDIARLVDVGSSLAGSREATTLLVVDQLEELILENPSNYLGAKEGRLFLEVLAKLSTKPAGRVFVIASLRSDMLGAFQTHPLLQDIKFEIIPVGPMSVKRFGEIILGPSERLGIRFEPGLVELMIADTAASDALPLLAFTLSRLYEECGEQKFFTRDAYQNKLGGIQGAVEDAVTKIPQLSETSEDQEFDLRSAFLRLARISDDGKLIGRIARTEELPPTALPILTRFVEARLLARDGEEWEVVHESLFRVWNKLIGWLAESREFMLWEKRIRAEEEDWKQKGCRQDLLLRGGRIAEAEAMLAYVKQVDPEIAGFVHASIQLRDLEQAERRKEQQRRLRFLITRSVVLALLFIAATGAAVVAFRESNDATLKSWLASRSDNTSAQREAAMGNYSGAIAYLARALQFRPDNAVAATAMGTYLPLGGEINLKLALKHQDAVRKIVYSQDGSNLLTVCDDGTVHIWQTDNGKQVAVLAGPAHEADLNHDGSKILTVADDNIALLWNAQNGKPIGNLKHTDVILSARFSRDGVRIVTASKDKTARIWNAESLQVQVTLQHDDAVLMAEFDQSGNRVVTVCENGGVSVWEASTGRRLGYFQRGDKVRMASFSPDGMKIVTSVIDGPIRLWDVPGGIEPLQPEHASAMHGLAFSPDGTRLVGAPDDSSEPVGVWSARTGKKLVDLPHKDLVRSVVFSPDGARVLTACYDYTVQLWDVITGTSLATFRTESEASAAVFSPDGSRVAAASEDGIVRIWQCGDVAPDVRLYLPIKSGSFDLTGKLLAVAYALPVRPQIVDAETGRVLSVLNLPGKTNSQVSVNSVTFSRDSTRLVTAESDGKIRIWDTISGEQIGTFSEEGEAADADFNQDGSLIVAGLRRGVAVLIDVARGKEVQILKHGDAVTTAVFSRDGSMALTASRDHTARIWNASTGKMLRNFPHPRGVLSAAFSPDGTRIVTACNDGLVRVWDVQNGDIASQELRHDQGTFCASFDPTGRRIISGCYDGKTRIWNVATGEQINEFANARGAFAVSFSPDGTRVITGGDETKIWSLCPDHQGLTPDWFQSEAADLSLGLKN